MTTSTWGTFSTYIARAGRKGDYVEDLEKAKWYLQREIYRHATETTAPAAKKELPSVIFGPLRQEKGGPHYDRHTEADSGLDWLAREMGRMPIIPSNPGRGSNERH